MPKKQFSPDEMKQAHLYLDAVALSSHVDGNRSPRNAALFRQYLLRQVFELCGTTASNEDLCAAMRARMLEEGATIGDIRAIATLHVRTTLRSGLSESDRDDIFEAIARHFVCGGMTVAVYPSGLQAHVEFDGPATH